MWVRFEKNFRFKPTPQSTQHFVAGTEANVPEACGLAAMKAGAATALKKVKGKSVPESEVPNGTTSGQG